MDTELVWVDPDDYPPAGAKLEALRLEWTPPGKDRETRTLNLQDLTPRDDRIAKAACNLGAMEMVTVEGPLGLLGVWLFAGRQAGLAESYRELEPMFSMRLINAGDAVVTFGLNVDETAAGSHGDDADPT